MAGGTALVEAGPTGAVGAPLLAHVREMLSAIDVGRPTDRERLDLVAELERVSTRVARHPCDTAGSAALGTELFVRTPLGCRYRSQAPPLLGWGTEHQPANAPTCGPSVTRRQSREAILHRASATVLRRRLAGARSGCLVVELGRSLT